jgi:P-type E1-E2 ATPase
MIDIDIPSFGAVELRHIVSDFTGTLSVDGRLVSGIDELIRRLAEQATFHVLTADTFGTAAEALEGLPIVFDRLGGPHEDRQKADYVRSLGADSVAAIGNGNNDREMLSLARVGIAVIEGEGASAGAIQSADVVVASAASALGLLLEPRRLRAALRW